MATCQVFQRPSPEVSGQIERLVASDQIKGSDALCRILRYLGDHASDGADHSVKEFELATQVLGRRPEQYDSSFDSCVRVQVMRLRSKLAQYYAGPGALDPILITVPRGAYKLVITEHLAGPSAPDRPEVGDTVAARSSLPGLRSPWSLGLVGGVCLLLGVLLGIALTISAGVAGTLAR
jgi:hypothetical protein